MIRDFFNEPWRLPLADADVVYHPRILAFLPTNSTLG